MSFAEPLNWNAEVREATWRFGIFARARQHRGRRPRSGGLPGGLEALQLVAHVECRLDAPSRVLLQTTLHQAGELPGHRDVELTERPRCVAQDRRHQLGRVVAAERPLAGRHLVEDDPEAEDVGQMIDRLALGLLRGHVGGGADDGAFPGQQLRGSVGLEVDLDLVGQLGEPEIEDLHAAVVRHHDVGGLEVTVGDAALMGGAERRGNGHGNLEEALAGHPAARDQLAERCAVDVLHGDQADTADLLHRVDRHDVRVRQGGDRSRLLLEARQAGRVRGELRRQDLDGDATTEALVLGQIDLAHGTRAELLEDLVWAQRLADHAVTEGS